MKLLRVLLFIILAMPFISVGYAVAIVCTYLEIGWCKAKKDMDELLEKVVRDIQFSK